MTRKYMATAYALTGVTMLMWAYTPEEWSWVLAVTAGLIALLLWLTRPRRAQAEATFDLRSAAALILIVGVPVVVKDYAGLWLTVITTFIVAAVLFFWPARKPVEKSHS